MIKFIRIGGLVFFFAAAFTLVTLLIRVKQDYVGEWEAPVLGGLVQESSETDEAGTAGPGGEGESDGPAQQALQVGRSLFDTPSPISAKEISDLMNRLESRQKELDTRESALKEREVRLNNMMDDLERNRANVMSMAKAIEAQMPDPGASPEQEALAVEGGNFDRVAKLLEQMDPRQAAQVLQVKDPAHSAAILLKIKDSKASSILEGFTPENLQAVTDALLHHEDKKDNGDS